MEDNRFVLQAGSAHGVTPGAVFSVYKDRDSAITDPGAERSIGSLTASDPDAFSTRMIVTSGTPIFVIGEGAFALQTRAGEEEDLRIHVPFDEKLLCVFQAVAREMKNRTASQQRIVLVDEATASFDFSITPYYQPATSAGRADPSVPAKQALTIGYGDGGVPAFKYYLREGQDLDIGFIKIFLSTEQVDLSHIRQLSPFNPGGRNAGIGKGKPKATWDTILIPVVQRKAK
ncbi:hypothetical protein FRC18_007454 [Serendipita sp. 400]|nr:hypothetical protein FRC18_007454 [Serendipita sp. 400]